MRNNNNNKVV